MSDTRSGNRLQGDGERSRQVWEWAWLGGCDGLSLRKPGLGLGGSLLDVLDGGACTHCALLGVRHVAVLQYLVLQRVFPLALWNYA